MAHLDLEEQEQLDQIKHVWKQYGNLISNVLLVVLLAVACLLYTSDAADD